MTRSWQDSNPREALERISRAGASMGWLVILVVVVAWLGGGIYTVDPQEVGLVKRFGKYTTQSGPGFHYRLPWPIESVVIVDQRSVRTEEIGFIPVHGRDSTDYPDRPEEAQMLTRDFNMISVETIVQYDVTKVEVFAFEVENFRTIIREAAQAVIRERVATRSVDEALTEKREEIANEVMKELQQLLDAYGTGLRIINVRLQEVTPPTQQVAAAFDDVNSAVQDKERLIFEAKRYANEQIPRAEGQAQQILNQAEGYKQSRILGAEGDVARFSAVLARYRGSEAVTEARMYIETMEEILPYLNKVILTRDAGNLLGMFSLEKLLEAQKEEVKK